jgi:hypothetical protein
MIDFLKTLPARHFPLTALLLLAGVQIIVLLAFAVLR